MKKRIYSLFLIVSFVLSLASFKIYAGDYENNWAATHIKSLVDKGFVSGDENGNVNPDNYIKRSEFVKVINKIMGYTNKSNENFNDIDENSWYSEEFLIAKANGVINGDESGNANPENNILREEAFKIISETLKLTEESDITFADEIEISDWAVNHIKKMVSKGIIKGYEDGTIRPRNNITRAEAFYILSMVYNLNKENQTPSSEVNKNQTGNVIVTPSRPSYGGGGGSSGGSSGSSSSDVSAPVITLFGDDLVLNWKEVDDAYGYIIYLDDGTNEKEFEVEDSETSYDLKKEISELCEASSGTDELDISIYMTAINKKGKESKTSKEVVKTVNVSKMISTADLGLEVDYGIIDTVKGFYVSWNSDSVTKVTVKLKDGNKVYDNPVQPLNITEDISAEGFSYVIIATADEGKQMVTTTLEASYFESGSGTEDDPYVVAEGYQFENIAKNMSAHYVQSKDIVLEEGFKTLSVSAETPFTGTYKSTDDNKSISVDIISDYDYTSLFGQLSGAEIDGITVKGSIKTSGSYTGAIAGEVINSTVINCKNEMTIESEKAYTGGLIGNALDESKIEYCTNSGTVKSSAQYLGGIVGNVESKAASLADCTNSGTVTSLFTTVAEAYIGGIVGKTQISVQRCVNDEDAVVTGGNATGGIAGYMTIANSVIEDCTNKGEVKYSSNTGLVNIGGIIGILRLGTVKNCVNDSTASVYITTPGTGATIGAGGIAGQTYAGTLTTKCTNKGNVNVDVTGRGAYIGGIVGNTFGDITYCSNVSDNILAMYGGAIAGRSGTGKIAYCFNTGNISAGSNYIGGISGRNDSATVTSCFNTGIISGKNAAGLVSLNDAAAATVSNSYTLISGEMNNAVCQKQAGKVNNVYYVIDTEGSLINTTQYGVNITKDALIAMPEGISQENGWILVPESDTNKYLLPQLSGNPYNGDLI